MTDFEVLKRLLVITALAGAIGYERERHGRAAGFRTHILVGIGSCLVMLTGLYLMEKEAAVGRVETDPTRMAAQVVSGIGFLGAGTILQFRASVRGLTTAASLWAVAGIGLAVGAGFLSGALLTGMIVIIALFALARVERAMRQDFYQTLILAAQVSTETLVNIRSVLSEYGVEICDFDVKRGQGAGLERVEFDVKLLSDRARAQDDIIRDMLQVEGVQRAHWA